MTPTLHRGISTPPVLPTAELGQWHVLHVKSRQEKALADDLAALRIGYYLPLIRVSRYYGKRKAMVDAPLFPGYVFMRGMRDDAYRADRTKRVANIIHVADQRQIDWELRNIHMALSNRASLDPYPFLTRGVRVEVRSGPLAGLQGIIADRTKADRLVLQVHILGAATSLEIDGAMLEVLD